MPVPSVSRATEERPVVLGQSESLAGGCDWASAVLLKTVHLKVLG